MNNNLTVFAFEGHEVRCIGTPENPQWVAQDVCEVLGLNNASQALSRLDDDEKAIILNDSEWWKALNVSNRADSILMVNESGLYSLVLSSRKAVAKRFKRWLTHEVIPAIRKTGSYSIPEKPQALPLADKLNAMEQMLEDMGINPVLLRQVKLDTVAKYNPELKDMAELGKKLLGAQNPLLSVGLTPTQLGAKLDPPLSARQVNAKLEAAGLQYRDCSGKKPIWQLTDAGREYARVFLTTNDKWSGAQIHWQPEVLDLIADRN